MRARVSWLVGVLFRFAVVFLSLGDERAGSGEEGWQLHRRRALLVVFLLL